MHIHANQTSLYAQLDARYAAESIDAKLAAENTRKKLKDLTSKLRGEDQFSQDCVVKLQAREDTEEGDQQSHQQQERGNPESDEQLDSEDSNQRVSEWT